MRIIGTSGALAFLSRLDLDVDGHAAVPDALSAYAGDAAPGCVTFAPVSTFPAGTVGESDIDAAKRKSKYLLFFQDFLK